MTGIISRRQVMQAPQHPDETVSGNLRQATSHTFHADHPPAHSRRVAGPPHPTLPRGGLSRQPALPPAPFVCPLPISGVCHPWSSLVR